MASDQTRQVVQDAVDLSKAGLKLDAGEVAEKTGYRVVGRGRVYVTPDRTSKVTDVGGF